jgi:hypothetical protein
VIALFSRRHEIIEFICCAASSTFSELLYVEFMKMLYTPEDLSLLSRVREKAFSGVSLALALLAMTGWVYLLGAIFLKFVLWCFYYFSQ